MAGWIGPTIAISLAIMALSVIGLMLSLVAVLRAARTRVAALERELGDLRRDLAPVLTSATQLAERSRALVTSAEGEANEYLALSRRVRADLERVARRGRRRLADLEAVADVVQEEVEDSALQLTSALRTVRSGAGLVSRLRRLIRPRPRRRS